MPFLLWTVLFILFLSDAIYSEELCEGVQVKDLDELNFSETEKRLVCGDEKLSAWAKIPAYQAKFHMKSFLQSRGYLSPNIQITNNTLKIDPGKIHTLKNIRLMPSELIEAKRIEEGMIPLYRDLPITPKLLDQVESGIVEQLRENSYACAKAQALIFTNGEEVIVQAAKLDRYKFGEVELELDEADVLPEAMKRFYPFEAEQGFNSKLLALAEKRVVRSGVAQATFFIEGCKNAKLSLSQGFIWGPPRVLRFGVGASTELGPMLRASWSNNRYKNMASKLSAKIEASFRQQVLELKSDYYHWEGHPRRSVLTELEISRENQNDFEEVKLELGSGLKWGLDSVRRFWSWSVGPKFTQGFYNSDFEEDSKSFEAISISAGVKTLSHDYELYDFHPQQGSSFFAQVEHRPRELGFDNTLSRLGSGGTIVGKLFSSGRGVVVGAVRFLAQTGLVDDTVDLEDLPPSVKYYGGGSNDLRGFQLKSRPKNDGLGALSKLLVKTELRKTHFFNPALEGFLFYDSARFGERSLEISNQTYHSPGVGIRWMSPIGLAQFYYSQAITTSPTEQSDELFYAGLGGEF